MNDTIVFVCTLSGGAPKWSRYVFPFAVDCFAQLGNVLYIRSGDVIRRVDADLATDEVDGVPVNFPGTVWWPWINCGSPGRDKMLEGFDIVATGGPSVSIGYDQRDLEAFTTPYAVDDDTMAGGLIPLPLVAPTFSVKVEFAGGEAWSIDEVNLYLLPTGGI